MGKDNNKKPLDKEYKNKGLNHYKYSKIKTKEKNDAIDTEYDKDGLNKYAYEDVDTEKEIYVYAPNMASAKIQMQLLYGEDDGIYLYKENAYSKPLIDVETGEEISPSDLYIQYMGKLKSGEIKKSFQSYINNQIKDGALKTIDQEEGKTKMRKDINPETEATTVGSIGQFKRGGCGGGTGKPMNKKDYDKWSKENQNEDFDSESHFDEDEDAEPIFEEENSFMFRTVKDNNGKIITYRSGNGGKTWEQVEDVTGQKTPGTINQVTEADERTDNGQNTENTNNAQNNGDNNQQQNTQNNNQQNNEQNAEEDQKKKNENKPIVQCMTDNGVSQMINAANLGAGPFEVFKGKRDYNVVFANGLNDDKSKQFVDVFSKDYYVYPQKPPQGSKMRYQFLISTSPNNPISANFTEKTILKRVCRANNLNELNLRKEGTEEYNLRQAFQKPECYNSVYEAYIKNCGDDALITYFDFNKLNKNKIEEGMNTMFTFNDIMKENKNVRRNRRRVNESLGLGMALTILKDETGIADTDELLAKIDEFSIMCGCDPIFDESCRDDFIGFCSTGDDIGCATCDDFGGDELSDEDFDAFGEDDFEDIDDTEEADEGGEEEPEFDDTIDLEDFDFDENGNIEEDEGEKEETEEEPAEEDEEEEPEEEEEKKEESYRRRYGSRRFEGCGGKKKPTKRFDF